MIEGGKIQEKGKSEHDALCTTWAEAVEEMNWLPELYYCK